MNLAVQRGKRKKKKVIEEQLRGSMAKYFKFEKSAEVDESENMNAPDLADVVEPSCHAETKHNDLLCTELISSEESHLPLPAISSSPCPLPLQVEVVEHTAFNLHDPYSWPKTISDLYVTEIVKNGPVRISKISFPKNDSGRHFSNIHYTRKLVNGEEQDRRWLIYSESKDSVFCFPCRLFSFNSTSNLSSSEGFNNWKHLSEALKSHETSKHHKDCMLKWLNFEKGLHCGQTVDSISQSQIQAEQQRWRDILERLLAIVQFLASHNLAFRGHEESITSNSSGNFLDLVKLIAKFDPILREHLNQVINKTMARNHYLGKNIQNELIETMANHVKAKIVEKIQKNKYYSIILDCTRDISRTEQLSVILRTTSKDTAEIEEHFLEFIAVEKTTGEGLADYIVNRLQELGLPLSNCRGQGYDNGANMRGDNSGVQRRILNMNPLAVFVPCGCHSWNLVLGDAASSCAKAQTFFGLLQRLYTIFSRSSERWSNMKAHVNISLKPLSETRWECRIESVKAVRYQLNDVCNALSSLRENTTDCGLISECNSLENEITTYEFVVSLVVWYDILVKIHTISKIWQSQNILLDVAVKHLEAFLKWLDEYRLSGFTSALVTAKEIAEEVGIDQTFKVIRKRRKKALFSYESVDQAPELSPEDNFRINYFLLIVDAVQMSCKPRFEALKSHQNIFGFMYHINDLLHMSDEDIMKNCKQLESTLSQGEMHDVDSVELYEELKMFTRAFDLKADDVLTVLQYIVKNGLSDVYPNIYIALRIIATIPVTVASAERSFSKLKLIKTYLRNTMTQDRLSALAILSIENDIAATLNYNDLIKDFSLKKSRNVTF